jgi:hypothetical protein
MLTRVAHVALSLPGRWRDRLYCRRLRDCAEIDGSADKRVRRHRAGAAAPAVTLPGCSPENH